MPVFIWEGGCYEREDGTTVWHKGGWNMRKEHPAAEYFEQILLANSDPNELDKMIEATAERQRNGEERRDHHYRRLTERDYASEAAGK
jgi:hypothetical protein